MLMIFFSIHLNVSGKLKCFFFLHSFFLTVFGFLVTYLDLISSQDTAWDPRLQQSVRRLCLVVDSLMPHDYDSSSHHLVNLQHHVIQQRRLPEKEALLVFWDIARIVQQLHKVLILYLCFSFPPSLCCVMIQNHSFACLYSSS